MTRIMSIPKKSPFPGMDPYIDAMGRWAGFHMDFLVRCSEQLNERLPGQYAATLNERIELIDEQATRLRRQALGPDVTVVHEPGAAAAYRSEHRSSVATLEPHTLPQDIQWLDLPKQLYVEITHLPDENVVTDIELLSPSNKRGGSKDRLAYLTKRKNLMMHRINLVECDLLLAGDRMPTLLPLPPGDYYGFITYGGSWHECDVYEWSLHDPLPTLPVPLRTEDGEVALDLAAAFAQTYEHGRYGRLLKYKDELLETLREADRAWAKELIHKSRE